MRCLGINRNLHRCNRSNEGHLFCYDHRRQPIVWICFIVFTVIAGCASIYSAFQGAIPDKTSDMSVVENKNTHVTVHEKGVRELADVSLRFVYPKSPSLVLVNQSAVIAKNIKWAFALWNMDLTERNDPLPIPVGTFDWIKPHNQGGPQNLFDTPSVSPLLKQGDRLFGSVSLDCPECERGKTYIVYIDWGNSGWYAEVPDESSGKLFIPSSFLQESRIRYFQTLEAAVPKQSRISIGDQ